MYRLLVSKRAENEIKKLSKEYRYILIQSLQEIKEDPFLGKPLTRNFAGRFSYRVGVYRIIYKVNVKENVIKVISAGHRSVVYN